MAAWSFASQLLLIALLSWTGCCFPARGGSGRSNPYRDVNPGFPPPPTNIHDPAVSYLVDRRLPPIGFPPPPTDLNDPAVSYVVDRRPPPSGFPPPPTDLNDPAVSYLVDRPNPPVFPPPPSNLYGPGVSYLVDGPVTSSSARVEPGPGILPVPPVYQGGELSSYTSSFEQGHSERESQNQGFRPGPPFGVPEHQSGFTTGRGLMQSLPRPRRPFPPGDFYFFPTGPASSWHTDAFPY